jgi:hypothetical protein
VRQKIISEPELQQYVSFFYCVFFMLQLFSYWHCNCYTPSFAICTLFCNHTFSTFFATTHTAILQSYVVKSSCNCFLTGIATFTLPVLQFVHFFPITHSALFLQPLTQTNLQSHVVKSSCNCFILALQLLHLQFCNLHTFFCNHTFNSFFSNTHTDQFHMLSNLVAMHRSYNRS